jgi:hypothetical protein
MATGWPMKVSYANGDVYSSSDVNDTNGTINLLTSSTLSQAAWKNAVINGGMDIWQRGTSIAIGAAANGYTADRWQVITGASAAHTISRQATGDTTNLPSIQYCARVQRNSGQTGATQHAIYQSFESSNSIQYAGKTVTLSFYARRGANFSPTSNTLNFALYGGTGTDQNIAVGGYTGSTAIASSTGALTTTWTRYTVSGTVGATITELTPYFYWTTTGTAGTNDDFEITGVQLELGATATTFSRAGGTIQGELAACQRYYWRGGATNGITASAYALHGFGKILSTSLGYGYVALPVTMRVTATSMDFSSLSIQDNANLGTAISSLTLATNDTSLQTGSFTFSLTGTAGRTGTIQNNNSTSGYIGFSAEL